MTSQDNPMGKIYILPKAIKTIVRDAALQSYGVIGLAPGNVRQSFIKMFDEEGDYGISVASDERGLEITINLIVEYGLRIKSVTDSVAESVKYHVEKTMGVPVTRVNIHIRVMRISDED